MRLPDFAGEQQQFVIVSLDEPLLLAQQLGLPSQSSADLLQLEGVIAEVVAAYAPLATSITLSPELGYAAAAKKPPETGLMFCLERTIAESDPLSIPVLQNNWSVEYVRNNTAAAKLSLFARSNEAELVTKLELVSELHDACRYEGIDFVLELRVIDGARLDDEAFQEEQLRLVRLFRGQSELLAVEYPRTALGCLSVTAQLTQPWVLVEPKNMQYAPLKEALRNVLTGGAVGLVIRQSLLPTFTKGTFDLEVLRSYLQKEGRDRLLELSRICAESMTVVH